MVHTAMRGWEQLRTCAKQVSQIEISLRFKFLHPHYIYCVVHIVVLIFFLILLFIFLACIYLLSSVPCTHTPSLNYYYYLHIVLYESSSSTPFFVLSTFINLHTFIILPWIPHNYNVWCANYSAVVEEEQICQVNTDISSILSYNVYQKKVSVRSCLRTPVFSNVYRVPFPFSLGDIFFIKFIVMDTAETVQVSPLALLKMLKHGK